MSFIGPSLPSACGARVGQQRHLAAVLDGDRDVALVLRTVARHAPGADLAAVGDELPQQVGVLVVDVGALLLAEGAHLLLRLASRRLCHGRHAPDGSAARNSGGSGRKSLERRFVGHAAGSGRGPGIVGAAAGGATTETAASSAAAAAALTTVDLRCGVAKRGTDLVDLYLEDGALLAFLGLVGPLLEPTGDDHAHAALERLGDVLSCLPPHVAREEEALAVLPLVGLLVEVSRCGRDAELRDGGPAGREPQLGVVDEVADQRDVGVTSGHGPPPTSSPVGRAWCAALPR